jgi:hypothetical protein
MFQIERKAKMSRNGQSEKSGRSTRKSASPLIPEIINGGGRVSKVPTPENDLPSLVSLL